MKKIEFCAVILAAGKGTRMQCTRPKVLQPVAGLPMLLHVIRTAQSAGAVRICVVMPEHSAEFQNALDPSIQTVIQKEARGTAHAVSCAKDFIAQSAPLPLMILYGDTPLIESETLFEMGRKLSAQKKMVLLGMHVDRAHTYGRILCDEKGLASAIVEAKEATLKEQESTLCNSGVMLLDNQLCLSLLEKIQNHNTTQEFYLTDSVNLAYTQGHGIEVLVRPEIELQGVNTLEDLAQVEQNFQKKKREFFLNRGVRMTAPETVFFSYDTQIKADSFIEPFVTFGPKVTLENNVYIKSFSTLEGAHIKENAVIGPFARIRPGTIVSRGGKIGNFVEIKQAHLDENVKVSHLSYIGDATIGKNTNIGAGTITCNYDGFHKNKTSIGQNVFVGSNTSLVAPVCLEAGSMIAAGSTITKNVPKDALALAREKQINMDKGAEKFRQKSERKR